MRQARTEANRENANIEKIISKIRHMFVLAEGNSNEHEAAEAMVVARRMLQKYGLSDDVLQTIKEGKDTEWEVGTAHVEYFNTRIPWKTTLMTYVAVFNSCEAYYSIGQKNSLDGTVKPFGNLYVVGRPVRRRFCIHLYQYLVSVLWRLSYNETEKYKLIQAQLGKKSHSRAFADSYRKGAVHRLGERLLIEWHKERQEGLPADDEGPEVTALAVQHQWDQEMDAISKFKEDAGLKFQDDHIDDNIGDEAAFAKGYTDANQISLARQLEAPANDEYGNPSRGWGK